MRKQYGVKLFAVAAVLACMTSCAKVPVRSSESIIDSVLAAWMRVNYPDRVDMKTESGAYIVSFEQGSGAAAGDSSYVMVHYKASTLAGDIFDTNMEDIATRLGTKDAKSYYGTDIWRLGQGYLPYGIEEALKGVKAGAHLVVALPISASIRDYTLYNAFSSDISDNVIYELVVEDVVEDIMAYQQKQMEAYRDAYYPGLDTLSEGFFFKSRGAKAGVDSISDGATVKVRYVGRLLNGQVFDTNIEDTARKYRIYNSETEYEPLEITFYQDLDEFLNKNGVVEGFARAINKMTYTEKAETFFWSLLGYGAAGSKTTIPEYSPLRFDILIEEDK